MTLSADLQFVPDGWARASLAEIWVLRTLSDLIAQSLRKLQIRLRFYSFCNENSNFNPKLYYKYNVS